MRCVVALGRENPVQASEMMINPNHLVGVRLIHKIINRAIPVIVLKPQPP